MPSRTITAEKPVFRKVFINFFRRKGKQHRDSHSRKKPDVVDAKVKETGEVQKQPEATPQTSAAVKLETSEPSKTPAPESKPCLVLNLPNELFSDIFLQALPTPPSDNLPDLRTWVPGLDYYCHELNVTRRHLSQVCQRFRSVIFGTPSIWSPVALGRPLDYDQDRLREQLTNSGDCPLDIFIRPKIWHGSKARITKLTKLLQPHRHRLRCFFVNSIYHEELQGLFPVDEPVVALPLLEIFILVEYIAQYPAAPEHEKFMGPVYTPNLKHIELGEGAILPRFLNIISFPCLRTVILSTPKYHVPLNILYPFFSLCPQVEYIAFRRGAAQPVDPESSEAEQPEHSLMLDHVTTLEFIADQTLDQMFLIRSFSLPSLKDLKFGAYGPIRTNITQFFGHLLVTQADTLEKLTLMPGAIADDDEILGATLPTMKNLKLFTCDDVILKPNVLKSLLPDQDGDEWPCPKLRTISLTNVEVENDTLTKLVQLRVPSKKELNKVRKKRQQAKERKDAKKALKAEEKPEENTQENTQETQPEEKLEEKQETVADSAGETITDQTTQDPSAENGLKSSDMAQPEAQVTLDPSAANGLNFSDTVQPEAHIPGSHGQLPERSETSPEMEADPPTQQTVLEPIIVVATSTEIIQPAESAHESDTIAEDEVFIAEGTEDTSQTQIQGVVDPAMVPLPAPGNTPNPDSDVNDETDMETAVANSSDVNPVLVPLPDSDSESSDNPDDASDSDSDSESDTSSIVSYRTTSSGSSEIKDTGGNVKLNRFTLTRCAFVGMTSQKGIYKLERRYAPTFAIYG
ncbi:hypothetical protein M422DRAFT_781695 [Sphaerobolus stellatus SS14]|uniref:F-box domain-containing protein n=1 Tax=Sphaerobolus stellatus (strain SS14) TaxID=990650 RepID=A0A0C9VJL7_SPHS4|nr:hypothetical protein M422DRAFT_781695 [Sphaerobolus stellatus SS14]